MKRYLTIILSWMLVLSTSAATYYASPEGGGDGTSYAKPTTFGTGLKMLKNPGDTLYLLSGQYDLGTTDVNRAAAAHPTDLRLGGACRRLGADGVLRRRLLRRARRGGHARLQ